MAREPRPVFSPFLRRLDPRLAAEDVSPGWAAFESRRKSANRPLPERLARFFSAGWFSYPTVAAVILVLVLFVLPWFGIIVPARGLIIAGLVLAAVVMLIMKHFAGNAARSDFVTVPRRLETAVTQYRRYTPLLLDLHDAGVGGRALLEGIWLESQRSSWAKAFLGTLMMGGVIALLMVSNFEPIHPFYIVSAGLIGLWGLYELFMLWTVITQEGGHAIVRNRQRLWLQLIQRHAGPAVQWWEVFAGIERRSNLFFRLRVWLVVGKAVWRWFVRGLLKNWKTFLLLGAGIFALSVYIILESRFGLLQPVFTEGFFFCVILALCAALVGGIWRSMVNERLKVTSEPMPDADLLWNLFVAHVLREDPDADAQLHAAHLARPLPKGTPPDARAVRRALVVRRKRLRAHAARIAAREARRMARA